MWDGEPQRGSRGACAPSCLLGYPMKGPRVRGGDTEGEAEGDKEAMLPESSCFLHHGCDCGLPSVEVELPSVPRPIQLNESEVL